MALRVAAIPVIWGGRAAYCHSVTGLPRVARLREAVERISATDDRALRVAVLEAISAIVPFDAYAFLLTDPATSVGCSPVADVPDLARLPELIRLKYLTPVNRWTSLPANGCAGLHTTTGGRLEQSLLWREHLAGEGITDVASIVFRDRFGWWGFLDLWRAGGVFLDEELAVLADARATVTTHLRRAQATAFATSHAAYAVRGPGALVLSPALEVRAQTPQTREWLEALLPAQAGRDPVPAGAYNVASQLVATEAGVDSHPAQARVHLGAGLWLTLRADRLAGVDPVSERDIVVTMELSSAGERRDLFSRSHTLTPRESELLGRLAEGADTRSIARLMSISELTVQDHLKSVFTKTGTASRGELLARATGT
ncbi:putative LuxR family transcriptional regulator [metagenome]|uniref:Putative LuxR family transcriptional regulator n=1 Tax=metagenome TaxID=256318 RepID=A0A2P2CCE6_9ZZZZ